jgi:hypothetical protein
MQCLEDSKINQLNKLQICFLPQNNNTFHIFQKPLWKVIIIFLFKQWYVALHDMPDYNLA